VRTAELPGDLARRRQLPRHALFARHDEQVAVAEPPTDAGLLRGEEAIRKTAEQRLDAATHNVDGDDARRPVAAPPVVEQQQPAVGQQRRLVLTPKRPALRPQHALGGRIEQRDGVDLAQRDQQVAGGERPGRRGAGSGERFDRVRVQDVGALPQRVEQPGERRAREGVEDRGARDDGAGGVEGDDLVFENRRAGPQLVAAHRALAEDEDAIFAGRHPEVVEQGLGATPDDVRTDVEPDQSGPLHEGQQRTVGEQRGAPEAARVGGARRARKRGVERRPPAVHRRAVHRQQDRLVAVAGDDEVPARLGGRGRPGDDAGSSRRGAPRAGGVRQRELARQLLVRRRRGAARVDAPEPVRPPRVERRLRRPPRAKR
jgi:hypothetical protein